MDSKLSKKMIILLPLGFILGIVLLYFFARSKTSPTTISLPLLKTSPTPQQQMIIVPTPTVSQEIITIEEELNLIEKDLEVAKKEDRRLVPPSFILDLGF